MPMTQEEKRALAGVRQRIFFVMDWLEYHGGSFRTVNNSVRQQRNEASRLWRVKNRDRWNDYSRRRRDEEVAAITFLRSCGINLPGTKAGRYAALKYVRQVGLLDPEIKAP